MEKHISKCKKPVGYKTYMGVFKGILSIIFSQLMRCNQRTKVGIQTEPEILFQSLDHNLLLDALFYLDPEAGQTAKYWVCTLQFAKLLDFFCIS